MEEGRSKAAWDTASAIIAAMFEVNRDTKRRTQPYTPAEFNPYRVQELATKGRSEPNIPYDPKVMKAVLVDSFQARASENA